VALTAEVRHNLFLAFKETLHNVIRPCGRIRSARDLKLKAEKIILMSQMTAAV